jgi:2-methylcitrate dehydratase PrpD
MITDKVSHFVAQTAAKDIPQDAKDLARLGIADFIGVALAGSKEEQSRIVVDYARKMGGLGKASIIGNDFETSPYLAALVNGTIGHALDYDDVAISLIGHPSVFLAPAILAVGESIGASGEDILAAYVIGYETAGCIAGPVLQSHYVQGWHSTATFGSLGAAAAIAWLMKLNMHQVKMSLGVAASLAGGLRQNFGTMTKPLHAGKAAANGVQAALLAQAGFTASDSIIEAPLGFAKVFGHGGEVDWAKASENLGKTFLLISPVGLSIKPYPSCAFTHCGIDAALYIREEHKVDVAAIAEVELGVSPFDKQVLIYHRPRTGLEAKFSLEYTVARTLLSGEVRLKHLTDEAVTEPGVSSLMQKMKWVERYPIPVMGTTEGFGIKSVTVKLNDGREYCKEVAIAKGMPQNPLTPAEFNSKYRDCSSSVLSEDDIEKSLCILTNLKKVENIREVMKIIAKK